MHDCINCIHGKADVRKYQKAYEAFIAEPIPVPIKIAPVLQMQLSCSKAKDERFYKVVRSMGTEVD